MPLDIHIRGIDLTNMEARMQAMARPAYAAISNYVSDGRPAILFTPTRKHAQITAVDIIQFAAADDPPNRFLQARPLSPHLARIYYGFTIATVAILETKALQFGNRKN